MVYRNLKTHCYFLLKMIWIVLLRLQRLIVSMKQQSFPLPYGRGSVGMSLIVGIMFHIYPNKEKLYSAIILIN